MPDKTQLRKNFEQMPYFYQRLLAAWLTAASVEEMAMRVGCFTSQIPASFDRAITLLRNSLESDLSSLDDRALLEFLSLALGNTE